MKCAVFVAVFGLTLPAAAQLNDGRPDPDFPVPDRLDLTYALAFALDNNFAIRQAKERIRQQEGIVLEVRAPQIPNVTASGGYQRNDDSVSTTGRDHGWAADITARQVVFAGGGVVAGVRSQRLALEAAVLALQAVINDALLDVRTRFYLVLVNRERIKVQEQNVDLLGRQLQDVKNRFEAGTVSNFEVLRAEVALANAQPALITARNDFRLAIDELRRALGFANHTEVNVTKIPEFLGALEFAPAEFGLGSLPATVGGQNRDFLVSALAAAREHRPDLLRLVKLETAAEQGLLARRAGFFPTVSVFGSYDWREAPISSTRSTVDGWTLGVQSTWDIFDGRATAGRVAQAQSLIEQSRLATAEAQLVVDVEIRRAISSYQEATELAEASQKVTEQAEESLRLATVRFGAGTTTQLDVLQAQTDLTTARLNQLQAYFSYNVAVATLRRAMGLSDMNRPTGEVKYP
ncbi:MAG: hypothetical protein A3G75_08280 [Verrucomicrobia bacterium RIFCSPLOWO2_12_FULL_64_8]|nr:MAG: hypothetical protein A3G75_08280 [Verrucomicrobia bacterium RIFCSPLOWO2_12_FULL_64_8]